MLWVLVPPSQGHGAGVGASSPHRERNLTISNMTINS